MDSPPPPRLLRPRPSPQKRPRNTKNLFVHVQHLSRHSVDLPGATANDSKNDTNNTNAPPLTAVPHTTTAVSFPDRGHRSPRHLKKTDKSSPKGLSLSIPVSPSRNSSSTTTTSRAVPYPEGTGGGKPYSRPTVVMPQDLLSPSDLMAHESTVDHYPDGPVLVFPPNVYLYSEPTVDEANSFDVIINVAKEVTNPYLALSSCSSSSSSCSNSTCNSACNSAANSTSCSPSQLCSEDLSLVPSSSRDTEWSSSNCSPIDQINYSSDPSSPPSSIGDYDTWDTKTTSTATSTTTKPTRPEYVYMPWDHNSQLTQDLDYLTTLIDHRVDQGKKVLIHCQCGVSRSASLVVAYVMKKRSWDLNTAYDYVKQQSPCISPNMTLMFQLIDWQRMLNSSQQSRAPASSCLPAESPVSPVSHMQGV